MSFDPEVRKTAIWSTEAAPALGLSERKTPAQLWAEKRGLSEPEAFDPSNISARLGLVCQDGIAKLHAEDTGAELFPMGDTALLRTVAGVPMGSHFDSWNKTTKSLHEIKFFGMARRREFGDAGTDVVPYDVLVQCLHEMVVWNADDTGYGQAQACEVNVVFGNVERAVFVIPYDREAVDTLLQREAKFWALVQTETPPEPHNTEDCRRIWVKTNGTEVVAEPMTVKAHEALIGIRHQLKQLKAQEDAMALHLQRAMGEAATLKSPDGRVLATWKNDRDGVRVDLDALRAQFPDIAASVSVPKVGARKFLPKG